MSFLDLFRPKWQHSDPEIRAAAVRALGNGDGALLAKIARSDVDAGVRRAAIKKIDEPGLLGEVAAKDEDAELRRIAGEKLTRILVAQASGGTGPAAVAALGELTSEQAVVDVAKHAVDEEVRRVALDRLRDTAAIVEVARAAKEATMRVAALAAIDDQDVLCEIAMQDASKEVGLAVVERLSDAAALRAIAKGAKNKVARKAAREKLGDDLAAPATAASQPNPAILRRARHLQLCRAVEELTARPDVEKAHQEMERLAATWSEMGSQESDDATLAKRMQRACDRIRERLAALQAMRRPAKRAKPEAKAAPAPAPVPEKIKPAAPLSLAEDLARRTSLCESAEGLEGDDQLEVLGDLRATWNDLGPLPAEGQALEERFRRAGEEVERRALRAREERQQREEEERRFQEENLTRLEEVCHHLENYVPGDNWRTIEKDLKQAETTFASIGDVPRGKLTPVKARLHEARKRLLARIAELKEAEGWERWANLAKLEQLCTRAEALRDATDLKKAVQDLKQLQADWKQVGAAPRDKSAALWQRFRNACDQVFRRCQEHFSQLEGERKGNLEKKLALCEKAESIAKSDDWKQGSDALKQLQAEWKTIGAVPKAEADVVWKRFRAACDDFFSRRKEHFAEQDGQRQECLRRKEELCKEVEALVDAPDVKEAMKVVRQIQVEWRTVGPAPKAQSDAVWKRFREACDKFYARARGKKPGAPEEAEEGAAEMPADEAKFTNNPFESLKADPTFHPATSSEEGSVAPPQGSGDEPTG